MKYRNLYPESTDLESYFSFFVDLYELKVYYKVVSAYF